MVIFKLEKRKMTDNLKNRSFIRKYGNKHITVLVLILLVSLPGLSATAAATALLQSDATWKVTVDSTLVTSGWNDTISFDDSAWQNATILYDVGVETSDSNFLGTKGMWDSGGQFSSDIQGWFRKTFTLPALSMVSLIVGCDDDCTVFVNGTQVINDTNGFANNNTVADLLPYLNVGTNLIAYTLTDNYLVYGHQHSTWVQLDGVRAVPEPSSIILMSLGLAGIGVFRFKKSKAINSQYLRYRS